jgi:hypothetical protein
MATMIAKKHKGDFDTYFFVIDNFVKHANAKGYNRHVVMGAMQLSKIIVSRTRSSWVACCFWRTTGNHGSSSWNI